MHLRALVIRSKDEKAVSVEQPAERLLLHVDAEFARDETDHLGLSASRMVHEVLGDRVRSSTASAIVGSPR